MTLSYYPETDSLYIELRPEAGVRAVEISAGLVVDLDAAGRVVGFDIDRASTQLDLSRVRVVNLPPLSPEGPPKRHAHKKANT